MKPFVEAIERIGAFSQGDLKLLQEKVRTKKFRAGEKLLAHGAVCREIIFLADGALLEYKMTADLEKAVNGLFVEGDWVVNASSFTSQKPTDYTIEAFGDSTVYGLDIYSIHQLIDRSPVFLQLGKVLDRSGYTPDHQRTPKDRYLHLMTNQPEILQRFPLKLIASYLQMTPETLSRVRQQIIKS